MGGSNSSLKKNSNLHDPERLKVFVTTRLMALKTYKYGIIICMFFLKAVILFPGVGNSHQEVASYHNIVKNYEKFKKNITRCGVL